METRLTSRLSIDETEEAENSAPRSLRKARFASRRCRYRKRGEERRKTRASAAHEAFITRWIGIDHACAGTYSYPTRGKTGKRIERTRLPIPTRLGSEGGGLRHDADIGPRRLPALRIYLLGFLIGDRPV